VIYAVNAATFAHRRPAASRDRRRQGL